MSNHLISPLRLFLALILLLAAAHQAWSTPSFGTTASWNAVTTYQSISLYWKPSGASGGKATVRFRENNTSVWREGHELWWDGRDGEFRGSLVELQPNTTYEIQLKLGTGAWVDTSTSCDVANATNCKLPVADVCTSTEQCTRTWDENIVGETIDFNTLMPASGLPKLVLTAADSGTPGNWKIYTATGTQNTTIDQSAHEAFNGDSDNCIILENVSYVVIRGLNLVGCRGSGIELRGNTHHVVIEDNTISGFGRFGTGFGSGTRAGEPTGDAGIICRRHSAIRQLTIQKNAIHTPRHTATYWHQLTTDDGHPKGPHGTRFSNCGRNHVFRYNDIYGTATKRLQDGLNGGDNFGVPNGFAGFPWADSDIYGNRFSELYDDAIEAEGENRNVRIWANYFDHVMTAIGNAATARGPLYVWRNVSNWMANMKCPGCDSDTDVDADRGVFIKGGAKDTTYNGGIAYYYHNTILQPPPTQGKVFPMGAGEGLASVEVIFYNFVSRNNIWHIHKITNNPSFADFWSIRGDCNLANTTCTPPTPDNGGAVDYDLFNGRIANAGANAETNAVSLGWGVIGGSNTKVPTYLAGGGYPTAIPSDTNGWSGDFRLHSSSLGTSGAPLLPNFNDRDEVRHVGAQPPNRTEMKFGRAAAGPSAVLSTTTPAQGSAPLDVTFSASGSSGGSAGIANLRLEFGHDNQEVNWTDKSVTKFYSYPVGNWTARLTVTDASTPAKTSSTTIPITVTSSPVCVKPTASFTAMPGSGTVPHTVNFNASASTAVSPATIASYSIAYGDGASGSGVTQSHTYTSASTFVAALTVTDSAGCVSDTVTTPITVNPPGGGGGTGPFTATLREGLNSYTGTTDSWFSSGSGNMGADQTLKIGADSPVALVRFKIFVSEGGAVPDGATITSATLSLYKYSGPAGEFKAWRLLKNWDESQVTSTVAATGTNWTTAGAASAGNDYFSPEDGQGSGSDAAANGCTAAPYPAACWLNINVTAGVQAFAANPAANFGWKLTQFSSAGPGDKGFNSSENQGFPSLRPTLTITYTVPQTVTLREGLNSYAGTTDSWFSSGSGNMGADQTLKIGAVSPSAVVRFKIFVSEGGAVPDGATITSATLSLYKYSGPDGVFRAWRLLKNWDESQVTATVAATGTNWTAAGAGSAGNDYFSPQDGEGSVGDAAVNGCTAAPYPAACWLNVDVTAGVQAFVANPAINFGWKIAQWSSSVAGDKGFNSSENAGFPSLRPQLTVTYTTAP